MGWKSKPKTPPPSEEERALAENAAKDWNRYVSAFLPVEDAMLQRTRPTEGQRRALMSAVEASAARGTAQDAPLASAALQAGSGSSGGRLAMGMNDLVRAQAAAVGAGATGVRQALRQRHTAGLLSAVSTGRGLASDSIRGLASAGGMNVENALRSMQRKLDWQQGLTSAASTALGAYARYSQAQPPRIDSGAGLAGPSKPWWDITAGPRKIR